MGILKIILFLIIIGLWCISDHRSNRYRDVGVPLILAGYCFFINWYLVFVFIFASVMRLGYGRMDVNDPEPSFLAFMTNDREGWLIRLIWGFIVSSCIGGFLFYFKALGGLELTWYVMVNTFIGYYVSKHNLTVIPTGILVASGIASILFLL